MPYLIKDELEELRESRLNKEILVVFVICAALLCLLA